MTVSVLEFNDQITKFRIADYEVRYFHPTISLVGFADKSVFDLTELINRLEWTDSIDAAALECKIHFNYHEKLKDIVGAGGIITVFGHALTAEGVVFQELFRVIVIDTDVETTEDDTATFVVTCFDHMFYTAKNDHTAKFAAGSKASDIIKSLCTEFQIPMGTIEDTGAILGRLIFRKESIYDMMITALSESRYVDGQRYVIRMDRGQLNVLKQSTPTRIFSLAYGENIYNAGLHKSISNLKTRVKLYGSETSDKTPLEEAADQLAGVEDNDVVSLTAVAESPTMQAYYGLLQHIETGATPDKYTDIQKYAEHLLSTLDKVHWSGSVAAPNINTIRWGDPINIYEPVTGLVGQFFVMASRHIVDESGSRMELSMHYERRLPEILFEKFERDTTRDDRTPLEEAADDIYESGRNRVQSGKYITPISEPYQITQDYGANPHSRYNPSAAGHTGIDIARGQEIGTNIRAVQDGTVRSAGYDAVGGNVIVVEHNDGYRSMYAHCNAMVVKQGQTVRAGQVIATVGQTGSADPKVNPGGGPHLHFQFLRESVTVNPRVLVPIKRLQ